MQEKIKHQILNASLKEIAINGWSDKSLRKACKKIGIDSNAYKLYFPKGMVEIVEFYFEQINKAMLVEIHQFSNENLKIRERIKNSILIRLKYIAKDRLLAQKTASYLSLPWNISLSLKLTWEIADLIWYEAGNDRSTDFNYYTKRSLLSGVYIATIGYYLNDFSEGYKDTIDFLDRKLENVIMMGKFISRFK